MPRSILKCSSSGKKKHVRLDLTPKEKEISPTNRLLKSELFYTARDFKVFEFDAMHPGVLDYHEKEAEEREAERRRQQQQAEEREAEEREAEIRRRQKLLWGDQQIRNYEPLQLALKRAAVAFSAAPPHKRPRATEHAPPSLLQLASETANPSSASSALQNNTRHESAPATAALAAVHSAAQDGINSYAVDPSPNPLSQSSYSHYSRALHVKKQPISAVESRHGHYGTANVRDADGSFAMRTQAPVSAPTIARPDTYRRQQPPPTCGGNLVQAEPAACNRPFSSGSNMMPRGGVPRCDPNPSTSKNFSTREMKPLLDRSNRNDRIAHEIEGLTMAQLKEKIQEVTRRRRARHKEVIASLSVKS